MRNGLVLALVLLMLSTGAASAAELSFSGLLEFEAETHQFIGPFSVSPFARMDLNVSDSGDNWSLDARLRTTWTGSSASVIIHRYRGVFETGSITSTVARNFSLGNVVTPFNWVVIASNPGDQLRVGANAAGFDILTQLRGDRNLYLRAQTDAGAATIGTGMRLDLQDMDDSVYTGYLTTSLGDADFRAIVGSFAGETDFAVGASLDVTEQLNLGATYASEARGNVTKGYAVDGTFTQGLLQAKAGFAEQDKEFTASLIFRGAEDNMTFGQLFDEDPNTAWSDEWYTNVAPAFGIFYTDTESDPARLRLVGVFPAGDNFVARARFVTQGDGNEYGAEGWLTMSEKATLNPYFSHGWYDSNTFGANFMYAVGERADITVTAERTSYPTATTTVTAAESSHADLLKVVYSISF